jgi:hypothetical protein
MYKSASRGLQRWTARSRAKNCVRRFPGPKSNINCDRTRIQGGSILLSNAPLGGSCRICPDSARERSGFKAAAGNSGPIGRRTAAPGKNSKELEKETKKDCSRRESLSELSNEPRRLPNDVADCRNRVAWIDGKARANLRLQRARRAPSRSLPSSTRFERSVRRPRGNAECPTTR